MLIVELYIFVVNKWMVKHEQGFVLAKKKLKVCRFAPHNHNICQHNPKFISQIPEQLSTLLKKSNQIK